MKPTLLEPIKTYHWEDQDFSQDRFFVSVSGGRSSMMLAKEMLDTFGQYADLEFIFANTGMEADETLDFVNECDKRWGLNITWLEAVVNPEHNAGTVSKVVTYETATRWKDWRNGSPFEEVIKKYGIPNVARPHCTRELKLRPMYHYINKKWGRKNYSVAVGLRADETSRMSKHAIDQRIIYPLVNLKIDKKAVNKFWSEQDFDLLIPNDAYGNCLNCWQKTNGKLGLVNTTHSDAFKFTETMETKYAQAGSGTEHRVFFRDHKNTSEMLEDSKRFDFDSIAKQGEIYPDESAGCSEGCEAFAEHQLAMFY